MSGRPISPPRWRCSAAATPSSRALAGGQSLGPMLNLRLAQPDLLVDLTAIDELQRVEESADALIVGACITHADIEDGACRT